MPEVRAASMFWPMALKATPILVRVTHLQMM
jgi:hypothetical protein